MKINQIKTILKGIKPVGGLNCPAFIDKREINRVSKDLVNLLDSKPTPVFKNPSVTVDIVCFCNEYNNQFILIKRKNEPFKDCWALPGGFIDYGKETVEHAAVRELYEETNIKVKEDRLTLVDVFSNPKRDPRGHTVSIAYYVELSVTELTKLKAKDDAIDIGLYSNFEHMAFDHNKIILKAINLRNS